MALEEDGKKWLRSVKGGKVKGYIEGGLIAFSFFHIFGSVLFFTFLPKT